MHKVKCTCMPKIAASFYVILGPCRLLQHYGLNTCASCSHLGCIRYGTQTCIQHTLHAKQNATKHSCSQSKTMHPWQSSGIWCINACALGALAIQTRSSLAQLCVAMHLAATYYIYIRQVCAFRHFVSVPGYTFNMAQLSIKRL